MRPDPERSLEPPVVPDYRCPVCGASNPEYFTMNDRDEIVGCDECLRLYSIADYYDQEVRDDC